MKHYWWQHAAFLCSSVNQCT